MWKSKILLRKIESKYAMPVFRKMCYSGMRNVFQRKWLLKMCSESAQS